MIEPSFYALRAVPVRQLTAAPALASWDKAGSPGQRRSADFVDDVHRLVEADLAVVNGMLGLRLDVGLPESTSLFARNDLDNYLFPLVPKLTERAGRSFSFVRATKSHGSTSLVQVGPVVPAGPPVASYAASIVTTAAASTRAYKEQFRDQLADARVLPGDGVQLDLAFVVGPRRAWPNLWKATIDSLGTLLGRDAGAGEWNARDGRITDLRLHCTNDPAAGNEVRVALRASTVDAVR